MVQLVCGARLLAHPLVSLKPSVVWVRKMVSATFPELVRVTLLGGPVVPTFRLPKLRLLGEIVTEGPLPVPVTPLPLKLIICVLGEPSSVTVTVPNRVPTAVGENVTSIVQVPAAATDPPM